MTGFGMEKIAKFLSGVFLINMAFVVPVCRDVSKVDFPFGPLSGSAQENGVWKGMKSTFSGSRSKWE